MLCPQCGKSSEYPSEAFGQWTRCPRCRAQVVAQPASQPPNPAIPFDCPADETPVIPDLESCRKCRRVILASLAICPHCGARQKPRRFPLPLAIALVFAALLGGVIFLSTRAPASHAAADSGRVLRAAIKIGADRMSIRNQDQFDWRGAEIYLNGTPPFAYRYKLGKLRSGGASLIPLGSFDLNGAVFQPAQMKITNIWVGADGFDFSSVAFE
ncbi:MAG TPA: hypothetical protein VHB20_07410 [Verrucomicrobiae bacterium]|nr:hypothetical protein [Verrucomicrobiae bacterium]